MDLPWGDWFNSGSRKSFEHGLCRAAIRCAASTQAFRDRSLRHFDGDMDRIRRRCRQLQDPICELGQTFAAVFEGLLPELVTLRVRQAGLMVRASRDLRHSLCWRSRRLLPTGRHRGPLSGHVSLPPQVLRAQGADWSLPTGWPVRLSYIRSNGPERGTGGCRCLSFDLSSYYYGCRRTDRAALKTRIK